MEKHVPLLEASSPGQELPPSHQSPVCSSTQASTLLDSPEWSGQRNSYLPCPLPASAQSVKSPTAPGPLGPNDKSDKTEAQGFGYLALEATQISEQVQSRGSWFHSTEQLRGLLGPTEWSHGAAAGGSISTWASSGTGSCCVSLGGLHAGSTGSDEENAREAGVGSLFAPAAGPACPGTCWPLTRRATVHHAGRPRPPRI